MTINFYLNNDPKSPNPEKIIFAYIRENRKTFQLHTGERINPKYWNKEKQQAKKSLVGSPELNYFLNNFQEEIKKIIREVRTENLFADFETVKKSILEKFKKNQNSAKFFDVFDDFIKIKSVDFKENSIKKFITLKNHLLEFEKFENYPITFQNIDIIFFEKFRRYLIKEKQHVNNTIHKNIRFLKQFLNWATERNLNKNKEYLKFRTKTEATDFVYLTENELINLYNLNLNDKPTLEEVRDVFCFGCFIGFSYKRL